MTKRLISYLQLMRIPAVFTALSNILAAHLIATQGDVQWELLIILLFVSAFLYLAGMVLNDCFDYQEDASERPHRPLPSGSIALSTAWRLGWGFLAAGLLLTILAGITQFLLASLLAFLIVLYNAHAKNTPYGVFVMGGCRYVNWLLGLSVAALSSELFILALPIFIYVCALTLLSTVETTAAKRSFVAVTGVGIIFTAFCISWLRIGHDFPQPALNGILLALLLLILSRLYRTYMNFSPHQIQKTIKMLVIGIVPLDAVMTLANSTFNYAIVILLLLLPSWLLARSMRVT